MRKNPINWDSDSELTERQLSPHYLYMYFNSAGN